MVTLVTVIYLPCTAVLTASPSFISFLFLFECLLFEFLFLFRDAHFLSDSPSEEEY